MRRPPILLVFSLVLSLLILTPASADPSTPTIADDGMPVELDNLWEVTPTVGATITQDWQLTITGLGTIPDDPTDRKPATLTFYVYPDFPEFTDQCNLTPQPYLTTLPEGAVTPQTDGSFELTFNLNDLEQNYCPKTLQDFVNQGQFGSRLEVSDTYGNPVLYSEPFNADLTPSVPVCLVADPLDGIAESVEEISAMNLDPKTEAALISKLEKVETELLEEPPDMDKARRELFKFIDKLEHEVARGDITADQANDLLHWAGTILASLRF